MTKDIDKALLIFFKKRVSDPILAEDLKQDVLLKIIQKGNHEEIQNLQSWIFRIAQNTLIDFYRKRKIKQVELEDSVLEINVESELNNELLECLRAYVDHLDQENSELLRQVDFENIPQKELAERMQINYPSLRSKVQRARKKLHQMFIDNCEIIYDARGGIKECQTKNPCINNC